MNINQLQRIAIDSDIKKFKVIGLKGEKTGHWLDPDLGLLQFDGAEGVMTIKSFLFFNDLDWIPVLD